MRKPSIRQFVGASAIITAVALADHFTSIRIHISTKRAHQRALDEQHMSGWQSGYESGQKYMYCFCTDHHYSLCPVKANSKI